MSTKCVLEDVESERKRQEQLKAAGRFKFTCADKDMTHLECLAVLGEEFGETAHEVNETIGGHRELDLEKLRKELIQVAAVCVAWAEKIDDERNEEPDIWPGEEFNP